MNPTQLLAKIQIALMELGIDASLALLMARAAMSVYQANREDEK